MDDDQAQIARALGAAIRETRKGLGLTMSEVARSTELSQPFLSQIENGNTTPSVINLHKIAQTLGTTAHALLEQSDRMPTVVSRAGEAKGYSLGQDARVRFCISGRRLLYCNEVTAGPHSESESATSHAGEEFVYVISGELRMSIEGRDYLLHPGDTIHYAATATHRWHNDSDAETVFLFVSTPPSF